MELRFVRKVAFSMNAFSQMIPHNNVRFMDSYSEKWIRPDSACDSEPPHSSMVSQWRRFWSITEVIWEPFVFLGVNSKTSDFIEQNSEVNSVKGLPEISKLYARYKTCISTFCKHLFATLNSDVTVKCSFLKPDSVSVEIMLLCMIL